MFDLGDKNVLRSITVIAAVLFAVIQVLESLGIVPPGVAVGGGSLAGLAAIYGLRRAISTNGLSALLYDLDTDEEGDALDEQAEDYQLTDEDYVE